jgi:hypothetical protein
MRARVIIEYTVPSGDCIALRDREEQRWITSDTLLALPAATVKAELIEGSNAVSEKFRKLTYEEAQALDRLGEAFGLTRAAEGIGR